jgi:hypothetical protein
MSNYKDESMSKVDVVQEDQSHKNSHISRRLNLQAVLDLDKSRSLKKIKRNLSNIKYVSNDANI